MIYVDDVIIMTQNDETLGKAKDELNRRFEMKDMGFITWFIGIIVEERPEGKCMLQTSYVDKTC